MKRNRQLHIKINQRSEEDLEEIARLELLWAGEDNMPNPYQPTQTDELAKYPYLLAARLEDKIVGYITAEVRSADKKLPFPIGSKYIYIEGVYVIPASRSQGIGGDLLEALVKKAKSDGIIRFHLVSVAKDASLVCRMYAKHGFRRFGGPGKLGEYDMICETMR